MPTKKKPVGKLPSKKSMHQPEYQPVLRNLYGRLLYNIQLRDQWMESAGTVLGHMENALKYQHRAEALLELLESVTVMQVGGGFDKKFGAPLEVRVESFAFLSE